MSIESTLKLFEEFKQHFNKPKPDLDKCKALMDKLKVGLTQLSIPLPTAKTVAASQKELVLAREILEHAVLLSVKAQDITGFERYFAQVKPYYYDYAKYIPESQRQFSLLGLNLLRLLAQNRIAEFHSELELIPLEQHQNVHIRHPIAMEQYIMEGSYPKVRAARADVPDEIYALFMDILMDTIRNEVADCSERAFRQLPVSEMQKMLQLSEPRKFQDYIGERSWNLNGNNIVFHKPDTTKAEIPNMQLIKETLHYAKELERIV
jgi:26S proteasome regulatory subunit N12